MRVAIFGGAGFLGKRLAQELLERGGLHDGPITELVLFDKAFPSGFISDPRLRCIEGDFSDPGALKNGLESSPEIIFHLAAVVSGEAEKKLDLGMQVNLHATLQLLETCRGLGLNSKLVFASSCAVFGGDVSKAIVDETAPVPRSSYGTQKAISELLINDYSRRGFIDGRSLRLPTIAIRPRNPNAATSSFVSSIIREPLNGKKATCPVPPETEVWIQSPRSVTSNFIHAANIDKTVLGDNRIVTLAGLTVSVNQMVECLRNIGGDEITDLIEWKPDEFLQSIVLTWPPHFSINRATKLGFVHDESAMEIINAYIQEERPF